MQTRRPWTEPCRKITEWRDAAWPGSGAKHATLCYRTPDAFGKPGYHFERLWNITHSGYARRVGERVETMFSYAAMDFVVSASKMPIARLVVGPPLEV